MNKSDKTIKSQSQSNDSATEMLSFRRRVKERFHKEYMETVARSKELQAQGMSQDEAFETMMAEMTYSSQRKDHEGETMTLDEFKEKVRECLVKQIGEKQTAVLMKTYEDDFIEFMEKDYNPETTAMAMLMGY